MVSPYGLGAAPRIRRLQPQQFDPLQFAPALMQAPAPQPDTLMAESNG